MKYKEFLKKVAEIQEKHDFKEVKKNGLALYYVEKQTKAICLEAVKQNGDALKHVKKQTPEICLAAIERNISALEHVDESIFDKD